MENIIRKAIRKILAESANENSPNMEEGLFGNLFNKNKTAPAPAGQPAPAGAPAAQPAQKPAAKPAQAPSKLPPIPGKKGDYVELQIALQKATPQQIAVWMTELGNTMNALKKKREKEEETLAIGHQMMYNAIELTKKQQKQ